MAQHKTQEAASAAVETEFFEAASTALMTPVHCGRFLVTQAPDATGLLIALGGGGFYQTKDASGLEEFFSVVKVEAGLLIPHDTARALAEAILQQVGAQADASDD